MFIREGNMIKVVTTIVNKRKHVKFFDENGNEVHSVSGLLREKFSDQGELYSELFEVSRDIAELAGWHPNDDAFGAGCGGWMKFLKDKGKVELETREEVLSYKELVEMMMNEQGRDEK